MSPSWLRAIVVFATVLSLGMGAGAAQADTSLRGVNISARDGAALVASVFVPDTPGPRPGVIFITSWAFPNIEYLLQAQEFAEAGYVVLLYTPRGFYGSGGTIDMGGPKDISDVSVVIDWLLTNTPTDPARIGVGGISYGAGLSLLGAAFDARIRAVASMSGWTDLPSSMLGNQTRHVRGGVLAFTAALTGRPSPEMQEMLRHFFNNEDIPAVVSFMEARSPARYLDRINTNRPAIFMANAYNDRVFAPNPIADFFTQLRGPKRLELRPGGHGTAETPGLIGQPEDLWRNVHRWFDHFLQGMNTSITAEDPVQIQPRNQGGYETYPTWSAIATGSTHYFLGQVERPSGEGALVSSAWTGWRWPIVTGVDTVASEVFMGEAQPVSIAAVNRRNAGVWQSDVLESALRLRGAAHLHVTIAPGSSGPTTVIAYLYDTDTLGMGHLVTHVPFTIPEAVAGWIYPVDTDFFVTAYDVPKGNRLTLVLDTVDPLYVDMEDRSTELTFVSPPGDPSYVSLPRR
ncbi:CocE/NonD family hydrolase [Polyangium sp. 15x6]|uniref:CocE/NonD family hydrolase n=1 Tax=Polyangium sp. 15x6 TaxID=3042687 RepID=UPI00249C92BF|nr:CocE/NonD family hydrolase [Polyangium sp. 15x6]MDI3286871.1 CocE/NonD family hydrolase [Polyangium sp. 15x6]